jgi:oxygen-independent coproporphyrinogen-3 oxidase
LKTEGGFGLYLHWPFCQAKCPYCDFNSHVVAEIDQQRWQRAYLSEIDRVADEAGDKILDTVFFGGGTPSLMEAELVSAILDRIASRFRRGNSFEVTLEANPTSVEASRFRGYRTAGVNRLSMGIQSLNDTDLRRLGRLHSVDEARRAFALARETFPQVSFDLIYARQDQTLAQWEAELGEALTMAADHLSLYQLTIEDGTAFGDRFARGGLKGLPQEDDAATMYELTQQMTAEAGLPAYEVSNHARPGAESQHNLIYWRGGEYAGIGPGAHGRISRDGIRWATETHRAPTRWLDAVEQSRSGETAATRLDPVDQGEELLMMGLRIADGVSRLRVEKLIGRPLNDNVINDLASNGLLESEGDRLVATPAGRLVLNGLLRELLV